MWLKNIAFIALATMALASLANWLLMPPKVQALDQPVAIRSNDFNVARQAIDRQFRDTWTQAELQPTNQLTIW